jgi:hypothetical protein
MRLIENRRRYSLLGALFFGVFLICTGAGGRVTTVSFNSIIDIETEEVEDYMTFEGSQLMPIIKTTVSCRQAEGSSPAESAPSSKYEELWYRAGDPLGCVNWGQLGNRALALTQIRIRSKSARPSRSEIAAQANALVRIYLDSYLRFALLTSVVVPDGDLDSVVTSLARENFFTGNNLYGTGLEPSILLPLENESGSAKAFLHFNYAR